MTDDELKAQLAALTQRVAELEARPAPSPGPPPPISPFNAEAARMPRCGTCDAFHRAGQHIKCQSCYRHPGETFSGPGFKCEACGAHPAPPVR